MRGYESISSILNASQRAELFTPKRTCVAFNHQTIELRQGFRTAPEPVTVELPPQDSNPSSILRTRSTSADKGSSSIPRVMERCATSHEDNEEKQLMKKRKKVSFVQTEPEQELERSLSASAGDQCSCQSLTHTDNIKDMPSPSTLRAEEQIADAQASFELLLWCRLD
ncbi:unnamed protein product [Peronospora destructor]|uniref:Uncharacterized protein n=1 Tax=Peronospora destructor TaxID=86335 RepID=A0AAV0V830_9STRA|nr:unnamed protein product [Peronospora destructor]